MITGATTEFTQAWALPTGQVEAEIHSGPVRIPDGRGGWTPVDFDLTRQADGSVAAKAHPFGLRLSGAARDGEHDLVTLGSGDQASTMLWKGRLPEPVLDGPKATYPDVRRGVDLVVEATRTGYEQFFLVKNPAAVAEVAEITLPMRSKKMRYQADGRGGMLVRNAAGVTVGTSPAPVMWDARVAERSGERARQQVIPIKIVTRSKDRTDVTLLPDEKWLTDPDTVWPVTIDPSENWGPTFDAFVQTGYTTDQSSNTELKLGYENDGSASTARSFLTWPTASLVGKQIVSASVQLWNHHSWSCSAASWQVWTTGQATTATRWTNQPTWLHHESTSSQTKGYNASCGDGWVSASATSFIQRAVNASASTAHMGIRGANETSNLTWKRFHSSEGLNDPYIKVTYQSPPTITARATVPETSCVTGSGRPFMGTTTPTLRAQATDGEASPVSVKFEWSVPGGAVIGTATTATSPSGSWLQTTVPGGNLSNSGNYAWRAQANDGTAWGPWSPYCEFTVDTSAPGSAPSVSSTVYPERPPTPTGYISSTESRPFVNGSSLVALTGDDARASVSLPFPFTFYGQQYTTAWIDTNGQLSFLDAGTFYNTCDPLPTASAPNAVIYAFCDDLNVDASSGVYTATSGTAPNRQFVVEWRNVIRNASVNKPIQERVDVVVVLHEDGEIAVNYGGIDADPEEEGGNALIGVENATGTLAEQYSYRTRVLENGKAVIFRPGVLPFTSYAKTTATQSYTGASQALALFGDDEVEQVTLPFPFAYYGQVYGSVWVDINGQVYFTDPQGSHDDAHCVPIPNTALPNGGISPYCDDFKIDAQSSVRVGTTGVAPNRTFTIEWWNARHYDDAAQRVNVTAALGENGTITFNYSGLDTPAEQGLTALVGIEHKAGTSGIQHSYHSSVLTNNGAIIFTPQYGQETSTGGAGIPGAFTFGASGITDVASYQYGLNVNPPDSSVNAATLGGNGTATITPEADGPQVLFVRSQDRAGNQSPLREYHFFAGPGGLTSPKPGDVTGARFAVNAEGHPASTGVTYQWRRGDVDAWANIPTAHVTYTTGGSPVAGWPIPTSGSGKYPKLNWDVEATLAASDPQLIARDGPLQVRAIFSGLSNGEAKPVKVTFDRNQASAASQQVGPGSVNLITGNYTVGQADVSVSGLSVGRSFNTRQPGGTDPLFGPGWHSAVLAGTAEAPYTQLNVHGSLVQVTLPDASTVGFTTKTSNAAGATFDPPVEAPDLALIYTTASNSYTLTDGDGNVVLFTRQSADPTGQYMPTSVTPPGSGNATTYSWEKVTVDGQAVVRPTRALGPVPAGVTCGVTLVKGCRALTFSYATSTTATGTAEASWGNYLGRVREVSYTAWDPDLTTPAMRTVVMARYAYDNTGRLRAAWDPRLDYGGGTQHVWTRYAYDASGVLTTITPPGQEPWQLSYTNVPGDPGAGRLHKVTRSALAAGTAVETVVYDVPVAGSGAPYDLSYSQTARWYQNEPPTDATAIFPATQVPTGNPATGTLPSSWERATVTYLDANARGVNTATPGGHIATTWYDNHGNMTRELSPGNRKRVLDASGTDTAAQEAALAARLSSIDVFSDDGSVLRENLQPEHTVVLPDGTSVRARARTAFTYDEGAPGTGGPFNLVTTQVVSARYMGAGGTYVDSDQRTTTTQYDWVLQQPTAEIVDPSGLALKTRTDYDASGRVIATTTPAGGAVNTTPSTRKTTYYTTAANATYPECGNRAEWANMVCRTDPGGQPATGPQLLATVTTYDMYGQARTSVEKNGSGAQRTTTIIYDSAGRPYESQVTTASGLGEPLEKRRAVYDAASGQELRAQTVSATSTITGEIIKGYDTLGRVTSYTDVDGNVSTTTYDIAGRVATTNDGKGIRTFTYDGGSERRGLPTSMLDSQAGTFAASYDADGALVTQAWPNGVTVSHTADEAGAPVGITYVQPACGQADCVLYSESATASVHDQWRVRTSTLSGQVYGYDKAARLTAVNDTVDGRCTVRGYGYDTATNRTSLTEYSPAADGACQTTTASVSRTWAYDTADRTSTSGYTYDALGRTTVQPSADAAVAGGGNSQMTYHVNDMARTITQDSRTATYTLDVVANRFRSWIDTNDGLNRINHYSDDGDSPVWTDEGASNMSRPIQGLGGIAGTFTNTTGVVWVITNLHGDHVAGMTETGIGLAYTSEQTEHGKPRDTADVGTRRYGWLGQAQRAADTPNGSILMGARLYTPSTGRFLSTDSVYGGSANPYEYGAGDPVGNTDVSGNWIDCSPSYRSGWLYTDKTYYLPYWKLRVRTWGHTLNARCKISHATTVWAVGIVGPALGAAVGAALGSLCGAGAVLCAVVGAVVGAIIGSIPGTWYSASCTRARGIVVRAWAKIRWGTKTYQSWWWGGSTTYSFKYAYGGWARPAVSCL